jgi:excisionase family DNA binding protein
MTPAAAREVMDVEQTADYIGISRSKLYELLSIYEGPPAANLNGRCRRFRKTAVDEWLRAREVRCADDERRLLDGRRKA